MRKFFAPVVVSIGLAALPGTALAGDEAAPTELEVSTDADAGAGSLRAAIEAANAGPGADRIRFGDADGWFASPRTITLRSPLPVVQGELAIDGRIEGLLWKPYGATVSGGRQHRVFEVAPGGSLRLSGLTVADGAAGTGAGVLNRGELQVEGVTFHGNQASVEGGAIVNDGGELTIANSTLTGNGAPRGGALANLRGSARITHGTLHDNDASEGAAVFNSGALALANSIVSGHAVRQCVNRGTLLAGSSHNLIQGNEGCGEPLSDEAPRLGKLGYYNGPTPVLPLDGSSPAINRGAREAAIDGAGKPLVWDQRGNGDPRFVAGYGDLGAFEAQAPYPRELMVDTVIDTGRRGCSPAAAADCPLRAALELAAVARRPVTIRFSPAAFAETQTLAVGSGIAGASLPLVLDGQGVAPVTISTPQASLPWQTRNGVRLQFSSTLSQNGEHP